MAISKLKPRHASEGRSIAAVLKDRLDYDKNPEKTDGGLLVTGYQCSPDTAWQEFAVSKQIYTATTGRKRAPDQDVISYLIIQSFEPGTITPEDANKLGYKLALEFTGGEHQFIVATHGKCDEFCIYPVSSADPGGIYQFQILSHGIQDFVPRFAQYGFPDCHRFQCGNRLWYLCHL